MSLYLTRARGALNVLATSAAFGIASPREGEVTKARFAAAYMLPALVAGLTLGAQVTVPAGSFVAGMSIMSGVLLALCTLAYNRVKDLAATSDQKWAGVDPMVAAYRFARGTLAATYVSFVATALLGVQALLSAGRFRDVVAALALALVVHLGVRVWMMLGSIKHQVEALAGQRSTQPPTLRQVG